MKQWKGKLMATTVAAAVLIGGFGGLATHQAFADDDSSNSSETSQPAVSTYDDDTSSSSEDLAVPMPVEKQVRLEMRAIVPAAAALLNSTPEAVNNELKNGKSLVEIAAEKGLHPTEVKDQVEKTLVQPIDQALAEKSVTAGKAEKLKQKLADQVQRAFSTAGYQDQQSAGAQTDNSKRAARKEISEQLANVLGMTKKELSQAMHKDGKSVVELAASKGISEEQLVAKLKDELKDEPTTSIQKFIHKK